MRRSLVGILLAALVGFSTVAHAGFGPIDYVWNWLGAYQSVPTGFVNPVSLEMDLGVAVSKNLYFGSAFDYWIANRGPVATQESLQYLSVGLEAGFMRSYPRMFWLITAGMFYPMAIGASNAAGDTFESALPRFSYRARMIVGIRISASVSFTLGGGYRWMNLGPLAGPSGTFPGGDVDLSGVHLTGGLTFTL